MISKPSRRWEKSPGTRRSKLYRDLQIPAKLFFEVLESNDLSKLVIQGNPSEKDIADAWDAIFDEYFKAREDGKIKLIMKTQVQVSLLSQKIAVVHSAIKFISFHPLAPEQRLQIIEKLKTAGIKINVKSPIADELLNVLKSQLPALETRLRLEKHNLEELTKGKKSTFEKALVSLETVFGYNLVDELTLAKYIAYEEKALQISNERRKQANRNKRKRK